MPLFCSLKYHMRLAKPGIPLMHTMAFTVLVLYLARPLLPYSIPNLHDLQPNTISHPQQHSCKPTTNTPQSSSAKFLPSDAQLEVLAGNCNFCWGPPRGSIQWACRTLGLRIERGFGAALGRLERRLCQALTSAAPVGRPPREGAWRVRSVFSQLAEERAVYSGGEGGKSDPFTTGFFDCSKNASIYCCAESFTWVELIELS